MRHLLQHRAFAPGNPLTVAAQVGGDDYNGPSHFTLDVQDDLVASMTIMA
jgi:hypothetical protein